ncbi:conserved hypothetical protein [Frankia canadensis]|uniref:Uncharacterized protein n=1 Tax=Frankia canadensis TaxID=1836972 RepID=A0A2I2KMI6_9ACTN|nr:conserved hypothetical protein [Frankia canadensis]SOU54152.1 conserved hypothetical protein [Frankia canadensis]
MTGDEPASREPPADRPRLPGSRITPRQVAHWRRSGLVRDAGRDLTELRVIVALRRAGMSLGRIRAAFEHVAAAEAHAVYAGELYVRHPDGSWEGDRRPGQHPRLRTRRGRLPDEAVLPAGARRPPARGAAAHGGDRGIGRAAGRRPHGRRGAPAGQRARPPGGPDARLIATARQVGRPGQHRHRPAHLRPLDGSFDLARVLEEFTDWWIQNGVQLTSTGHYSEAAAQLILQGYPQRRSTGPAW